MQTDKHHQSTQLPGLAILISGRGSNMLAIANACSSGELSAKVMLVISNIKDAPGLEAAKQMGIPTAVVEHNQYSQREKFDQALHETVLGVKPQWIVLAGFMRILGPEFVNAWKDRIVNIHPSLLPRYPGLNTHARAIAAGDKEAGASVHLVTAELDAGRILAQKKVPILSNDTPTSLAARVLQIEHALYINALKQCVTSDDAPTGLQ